MRLNLCPSCGGYLRPVKKVCMKCALELGGQFDENPIVLLAREEQDFLLDFVRARGNFTLLCEQLDLTYPTARSYLDRIIGKLETLSLATTSRQIIDAIDRGEIRPEEGIEKLKRLRKDKTT